MKWIQNFPFTDHKFNLHGEKHHKFLFSFEYSSDYIQSSIGQIDIKGGLLQEGCRK